MGGGVGGWSKIDFFSCTVAWPSMAKINQLPTKEKDRIEYEEVLKQQKEIKENSLETKEKRK